MRCRKSSRHGGHFADLLVTLQDDFQSIALARRSKFLHFKDRSEPRTPPMPLATEPRRARTDGGMDIAFSMGAHAAFGINMWKLHMQHVAEELEQKRLVFYLTVEQGKMRPWRRHASQLGKARRMMEGIERRKLQNVYSLWLREAQARAQAEGLASFALTWRGQQAGDWVFTALRSERTYRAANALATASQGQKQWTLNAGTTVRGP